ncbi:MAG: hypothetical protein AB1505_21380 [Candidatus Latescibacterota bacterium]
MDATSLRNGILGGLAGGVVFGMMMGVMGMLPMIGRMATGQPSAALGFVVHMLISAVIGASFAVLFGHRIRRRWDGLAYGLLYAAIWWLLGPLTLMPLFMGMGLGANWNATAAVQMLPSLMGHLIYGGILGVSYAWLWQRAPGGTERLRPSMH